MGLRFGFFKAKYFKLSFVSGHSRFMYVLRFILLKIHMLCMQVSSCLPNLSVRQGGSLLSYLRGLSVPQWSTSYAYLLVLCVVLFVKY